MEILAEFDERQIRLEIPFQHDGSNKSPKFHAAFLAIGIAFPILPLQLSAFELDRVAGSVDEVFVVEIPFRAAMNLGQQRGPAQQAAKKNLPRQLDGGPAMMNVVFIRNSGKVAVAAARGFYCHCYRLLPLIKYFPIPNVVFLPR